MTAFDSAPDVQRLEQRLEAFERLHADTVRELRAEIAALRAARGGGAAPQPPNPGGSLSSAVPEFDALADGLTTGGQGSAAAPPADDPATVQEAVEEIVETSLHQTVSRRELFGRHRADDEGE
jgi:hypothetical protein